MSFDPAKHHRRSIRLRGFDYGQAGAYFVTTCTQDRECVFGSIYNGEMTLNDAGRMINKSWNELPMKYSGIGIDEFVVMPNHIHGIIILPVGAGPSAYPDIMNQQNIGQPAGVKGQPQGVAPTRLSLPDVVHRFKSFTSTQYRIGVEQFKWQPFRVRLWQRNYYEHIIRSEDELNRVREYIINNPLRWIEDEDNPLNIKNVL